MNITKIPGVNKAFTFHQ